MDEVWKPVVGFEYFYEVSSLGNVLSKHGLKPRLLKFELAKGYRRVVLCRPDVQMRIAVHRVVAETFIGPCPLGEEVNHKDGDKTNNAADNLEYLSASANQLHAYRVLGKRPQQGSKHGMSKLSEQDVIKIRELLPHTPGKRVPRNSCMIQLAAQFKVSVNTISLIVNRKKWIHI